jgi:hypothetical protein
MMMDEHTPCNCDVCKVKHFERNHYFKGKSLTARDLADEQKYFNEKRWLINRMVLGWGVVCGFDLCVDDCGLRIEPGLALDCCGRELLVCDRRTVKVDDFIEALGINEDDKSQRGGTSHQHGGTSQHSTSQHGGKPHHDDKPVRWVLCLEYRECRIEPCGTPASCDTKGHGSEYNRIRDDYRLVIRPWRKACPDDHDEDCCPYDGLGRKTPFHQALVERSRHCPACKDCECVVLATGTIDDRCEPPEIRLDEDRWKYTRIVYTNSALASVLRCVHGGLPHVTSINWKPDARISLDEFFDWLTRDRLKVTFDQPMKSRTVTNRRSCRLTFLHSTDGSCPAPLVIPVERIGYDEDTSTATYYFDDDCIEHELRKTCKKLKKPAEVELVLHGNIIHNHRGRALDAELIDELPSGNGVEGGDFTVYFTVEP